MLLGFKQYFTDGTPTRFVEKIIYPVKAAIVLDVPESYTINNGHWGMAKLHTIRQGNRWRADMPIQMAYGVRTKKYWQFNKGIQQLSTCISVQKIFMTSFNSQFISFSF